MIGVGLTVAAVCALPFPRFLGAEVAGVHVHAADALIALALVMLLLDPAGRRAIARPTAPAMFGLAYVLVVAASWAMNGDRSSHGVALLVGTAGTLVFLVVTAALVEVGGLRILASGVAVTAVVVAGLAAAGLVLFYGGRQSELVGSYGDLPVSEFYARVQAGTYHPNLLASWCVFAGGLVGFRSSQLSPWLRRVATCCIVFVAFSTISRSALAVVILLLLRVGGGTRRRQVAAAAAVAVGAAIVISALVPVTPDPEAPWRLSLDGGGTSRQATISSSVDAVTDDPWFGVGLGRSPGENTVGQPFRAHLTPLDVAATSGVPASILFLAIPVSAALRHRRRSGVAWLVAMAADALTQDVQRFRHGFVAVGVIDRTPREPSARSARPGEGVGSVEV